MGRIPHGVEKAWGVCLRQKSQKDAGGIHPLMGAGTNLLYFKEELFCRQI